MKIWKRLLIGVLVMLMCLFICVGYAQLSERMSIVGTTTSIPPYALFITSINSDSSTLGGVAVVNNYVLTTVNSSILLGEHEDSTVTLHVTVYNNTLDNYKFMGIEYVDNELTYSNEDIGFEAVADYRGEAMLLPKHYVDVDITFKYKSYPISSNELLSVLSLHFHLVGENENDAVDYDEYIDLFLENGRYGLNDNTNQSNSIIDAIKTYGVVYENDNLQGTNLKNLASAVNTHQTEDLSFVYEYVNDKELVLYTYEKKYNSSDYNNQSIVVYKTVINYKTNAQGVTEWEATDFQRGNANIERIKTPKGASLYAANINNWIKVVPVDS